jgi:phosphohistidine phosphatase
VQPRRRTERPGLCARGTRRGPPRSVPDHGAPGRRAESKGTLTVLSRLIAGHTGSVTTIERTLILLRHAKSDWSGSAPDIDRPLAERGRAQAPLAGRWLANRADRIDLAIVSPAKRARETWELVSAQLTPVPPAQFDDRVYAASADRLLDVVLDVPDDVRTMLLVGHNPGMEQLASLLAGESVVMRTAGIAEFGVEGPWSELDATSTVLRAAGRSDGHDLG